MSRTELLNNTIEKLKQLDVASLQSINDYVGYVARKTEDKELMDGIMQLAEKSNTFDFLNNEPELYSDKDLIEKF